jgi:hypothetical protein
LRLPVVKKIMDYSTRIKKIGICFALLGLLLMLTAGYRMVWQAEDLSRRVYRDGPMAVLFQELAAEGIITPAEDGVHIDLERLRVRVSRPGVRQFIMNRQGYLAFDGDRLTIDPTALSVANRRLLGQVVTAERGRVVDRHGTVLARTIVDDRQQARREYPLGSAAFPLLGVAHPVYGQKGLERHLTPWLEGEQDERIGSRLIRFYSGEKKQCDVVLTLDAKIQQAAFDALGDRTGAVVVVEAATGDILAAASTPSFDPTTPPGQAWDVAAEKGYKGPFVNRAFQRRYPPGSTFKLITAAAWMEQDGYTPTWGIECKGRHPRYGIREYKGKRHGWVGLRNALSLSCNVFFAEIGVRLGPALGDTADRFGFNRELSMLEDIEVQEMLLPSRPSRPIQVWRMARGGVSMIISRIRNWWPRAPWDRIWCRPRRCRWPWWQEPWPTAVN